MVNNNINNSKLPDNIVYETPRNKLFVDLIGPYKISRKGKDILTLKSVTMIDPGTRCFEITQYSDKKLMTIVNLEGTMWLVQYL